MLLIIDNDSKYGQSRALTFYRMGILAHSIKPCDAFSEIGELYSAVLIIYSDDFADIADFVRKIRKYRAEIPVFAICDKPEAVPTEIFNEIFKSSLTANELTEAISSYFNKNGFAGMGEYSLAGMSFSYKKDKTNPNYVNIRLTHKEGMILRFLMRSYPHPKSSAEILKYVFAPSVRPEPSAVRTHISSINKQFQYAGERKIIIHLKNSGYIILTPEIRQQNSINF